MRSIIFTSMLVMHVSCMYPMESEAGFEHKITFKIYELLDTLPPLIRQDLLRKTVNATDKDYKFTTSLNRLFLSIESRVNFTPEHLAERYPWEVKKTSTGKYVMRYFGKNFKPFKITCKKPIVTGPNNNNVCVVDRSIVKFESITEDSKNDGFFNLNQHFAACCDEHKRLPAHPLTIHPDKNICVIEELTEESSLLSLYNLDTHETEALPGVQCDFGKWVVFGPDDTLLVLMGGTLYVYSLVNKKVEGIIFDIRYIPASQFDQFRENGDDVTDLTDFQRLLKLVQRRNNRNSFIRNFHYSSMYPDIVLLGIESYCVLIGITNGAREARMVKLAHTNPYWYAQPEWHISIKTYDQHDYDNPLNTLRMRDAVSLVSWHMNDLGAYVLTAAADNWLQNKEQNKKENKSEARSILSTLYHSNNRLMLLLKSTHIDDSGQRTNPFKVMFHAIKEPEHTHVTEVI